MTLNGGSVMSLMSVCVQIRMIGQLQTHRPEPSSTLWARKDREKLVHLTDLCNSAEQVSYNSSMLKMFSLPSNIILEADKIFLRDLLHTCFKTCQNTHPFSLKRTHAAFLVDVVKEEKKNQKRFLIQTRAHEYTHLQTHVTRVSVGKMFTNVAPKCLGILRK